MIFSRTHQAKKLDRLARYRTTDRSLRPCWISDSNERATSRSEMADTCIACMLVGTSRCRARSVRYVLAATVNSRVVSHSSSNARTRRRPVRGSTPPDSAAFSRASQSLASRLVSKVRLATNCLPLFSRARNRPLGVFSITSLSPLELALRRSCEPLLDVVAPIPRTGRRHPEHVRAHSTLPPSTQRRLRDPDPPGYLPAGEDLLHRFHLVTSDHPGAATCRPPS